MTFVQSLFLHGVTFIACALAFLPIQHNKVADPQQGYFACLPFVAVLLLFPSLMVIGNIPIAEKKKNLNRVANGTPDQYHAYQRDGHEVLDRAFGLV